MGKLIGVLVLYFYLLLSTSFVVSKAYVWFILPTLPTMPIISYIGWIGINAFLNVLFLKSPTFIKKEYKVEEIDILAWILCIPWIALLMNWLVKIIFF